MIDWKESTMNNKGFGVVEIISIGCIIAIVVAILFF